MKKTLKSILVISIVAIFGVMATNAFFSDTETSLDNTIQAGKVDLLIGNTSYYNGLLNNNTSWTPSNLSESTLFFNFNDLKPGDWGEDTIGITVDDNDAWACMEFELIANDDVTCTDSELEDDENCAEPGVGLGELGDLVNIVFWIDDGDNVLEDDEEDGAFIRTTALDTLSSGIWALADSSEDDLLSNLNNDGALIGGETYYIGKAWCFGELALAPLDQDNGSEPDRSPATTSGGIVCNGSELNNAAQTDNLVGNISFSAVQHRNNPDFVCNPRILADEVVVPSTNNVGVISNITLEMGKNYELEASGTYRFVNWGEYGIADAEWAYRNDTFADPEPIDGWTPGETTYSTPTTPVAGGLDIIVDGINVDWGDYSPEHNYTLLYSGTGSTVHFYIYDNVYSDNSGSLTIKIYELP